MTRTAIITGASTGIGAATARRLADGVDSLVLGYHRGVEATEVVAEDCRQRGVQVRIQQADLATVDGCRSFVDAALADHEQVDVLVNNAGSLVARDPIAASSDDRIDQVVAVNLLSVLWVTRDVLPALARARGAVVNVSSISGRNGGGGGSVLYATAKGGVDAFTRGLANELAPEGVRVNAVAPGVIDTPFHEKFSDEETMASMLSKIPLGRAGTADEVADAVAWLAGGHSTYVTGQVLHVNGGMHHGG